MSLHEQIANALSALLNHIETTPVILLHPRSRYRSVLIARLVNEPKIPVYYYAMGPDDIDLQSFLSGLVHDIANQNPVFGRNVNALSPNATIDAQFSAFSEDLVQLHRANKRFLLILDEYDRSDGADDIQIFVEKLVRYLPDNCRLIINSRNLPRLPWISLIARKRAVILEDERQIRRDFYNIEAAGKTRLNVSGLGPGQVEMNGKTIDEWEGHLPRLLFFFALEQPIITRSEICQAFWPELDVDQAVNVFHVTKRRLHKALDIDALIHEDNYYRINPDLSVHFDAVAFAGALMDGRDEAHPNRAQAWQKAIDLYRGPFLQGHSDNWIMERRLDFQEGYIEALTEMAYIRLGSEKLEHALTLFQKAVAEDPTREDIHREVMKLFVTMGRRSEAAAHYQRLQDEFKARKRSISLETEKLYADILD